MLTWLTVCLTLFSLLATILPKVPSTHWIFRMYDYPIVQLIAIQSLNVYILLFHFASHPLAVFIAFLLLINIIVLSRKVFLYTALGKKQVQNFSPGLTNPQTVSLLMWNVYQYNRTYQPFLQLIDEYKPDIILLCEVDNWWVDILQPLHEQYPYRMKMPQENTYGMALYSRIPLEENEIEFLISEDVPSFHATIKLAEKHPVRIHTIHPIPPVPEYSTTTDKRDAELLLIAKKVNESDLPNLVFGDLNDVAWSNLTYLFQKISRLLDPRRGRAIIGTFHAKIPFMRVPIDQFFCSEEFQIITINRLSAMNSDHFPLFIQLAYAPERSKEQMNVLEPIQEIEKKTAEKKIDLVLDKKQPESSLRSCSIT